MLIYQLYLPHWPRQAGLSTWQTLNQLDLGKLTSCGIDAVYLTGAFNHQSPVVVTEEEGISLPSELDSRQPSPMAITDHLAPHPDYGDPQDFFHLLNNWQQQGVKVMLDFVPNQTSFSHDWLKTHPEYYQRDQDGELVKLFSGDVYQLNYDLPAVRQAMQQIVQQLSQWPVAGLRCDMAHLVPISFWQKVITQVKQTRPEFIFVAEAYTDSPFDLTLWRELIDAGFDYVYDHWYYYNLNQAVWQQNLQRWLAHWQFLQQDDQLKPHLLHYLANHDDPLLFLRTWQPSTQQQQKLHQYHTALLATLLLTTDHTMVFNSQLTQQPFTRIPHHLVWQFDTTRLEPYTRLPHAHYLILWLRQQSLRLIDISQQHNLLQLQVSLPDHRRLLISLNLSDQPRQLPTVGNHWLNQGHSLPAGAVEFTTLF